MILATGLHPMPDLLSDDDFIPRETRRSTVKVPAVYLKFNMRYIYRIIDFKLIRLYRSCSRRSMTYQAFHLVAFQVMLHIHTRSVRRLCGITVPKNYITCIHCLLTAFLFRGSGLLRGKRLLLFTFSIY